MIKQSLRFFCFLGLLLIAAPLFSQEDTREEAQRYYQQADTDYKLQRYQEALDNFQRSYELSKEASILFNIGQCYRQLKQPLEAKKAFQAFLRDAPEHSKTASAEKLLKELDAELAKLSSKGSIQISSKQDPAEVFLNGEPKGSTPLLLSQIDPGDHRITLRKEGFSDAEMTVAVKPSEVSSLKDLQLAPIGEKIVVNNTPRILLLGAAGFGAAGAATGGLSALFIALANREQNDLILPGSEDGVIDQADLEAELTSIDKKTSIASSLFLTSAIFVGTAALSAASAMVMKRKLSQPKEQR